MLLIYFISCDNQLTAFVPQLYSLINRDYKDFITITTKLEGVDERVRHLRSPLIDLRVEIGSLHDNLMSKITAIDSKISKRREIIEKKRVLEIILQNIHYMDLVTRILQSHGAKHRSEADTEASSKGECRSNTLR